GVEDIGARGAGAGYIYHRGSVLSHTRVVNHALHAYAWTSAMARFAKATEMGLMLLAGALLASMLLTALHDVSMAWDVWYYHLPFAARIAGIVPANRFIYEPL